MQDRLFGNGSAQAAAEAVRTLQPRQVMLEMDQARYKNALEHISTGMHLQQPNRVDIVSTVSTASHGWPQYTEGSCFES
ncbi:hypothetical protein FOZ62_002985 [Perkinsus olseni]|uniref:Uncharacterized protein n=1 Tax=Perkinsus olseni TaxID=32597 RepID=A0A7J6S6P3_PEROL|nr:hypothetical protein FOZ62_002985 [Perkinsus olseni]